MRAVCLDNVKVEKKGFLFWRYDAPEKETKQCGQLEHYKNNASKDGMEPLFFNIVSWAKRCDDGHEAAMSAAAPPEN